MTKIPYNSNNIFAKILRGEIPSHYIYENDDVVALNDIHPQAPIHILIIPKKEYRSYEDFHLYASNKEIIAFHKAITEIMRINNISEEQGGNGARLITNIGPDGCQEIPHFHMHLLAGHPIGTLCQR